ncbi:peptidase inhibitor family I36 protein [Actinophytocola sp. NPDC049390]|uniref:peptidase inhibitor family I36 protein n=1 Tax=Actinophytocola sp. NPDC049390 TaxID=3363894 RepID=UPI0037995052
MRKKIALAGFGVALLAATIVSPPSAQAAARNGVCESGEVCLYYNSDNQGSLVDFTGSVKNYGTGADCVKFVGSGNGRGQCVKNNAASVWNRKSVPVTVFYKSGWSGAIDSFVAGTKGNLRAGLKNENAGHVVGQGDNQRLEYGVYHSNTGGITAYFDGYLNTSGRHEGIDFARGSGSSVYSLLSGTVIYKNEGGGGLSTLSIYNARLDRTVIYLHTNPLDGLRVGQSVSRGQRIATEAARGASAAHTHVEMRPGRRELAAPSVGDPTLSNPIPTSFWMARGYNICCQ